MTLEDVARRALDGDRDALDSLIRGLQGDIYGLSLRMLWNRENAEDATQEILVRTVTRLSQFDFRSKLKTWVYRIAVNAALMHRRAARRRPADSLEMFLPQFDGDGTHAATPAELRVVSQADEQLDRQAVAAKARDAIARLPDIYRDAFVLRDLEEMPTARVAQMLGVDPAAVRQRVHRARLMLRGYLSHLLGEKR